MGLNMKCPNCGLDNPESATKCSCGFDFSHAALTAETERPVESGTSRRNPIWAGLLSLVVPGLGQVYNGQVLKGVIFYIAAYLVLVVLALSGLAFTFWGLITFVVASIFLYVAIIAEAAFTSHTLGSVVLQRCNRWYVYLLVIIAAGLMHDYVWPPVVKSVAGARTYRMPASSMEPTLKIGDHFIARLDCYTHDQPRQSDIVIFRYPGDSSKDFVKRIIALEGQELEIRNRRVFIDGRKMEEPWVVYSRTATLPASSSPRDNLGPIVVPKGHVFVMGDNRDFSHDSRFFGPVDIREITGKALYIYWAEDKRRIGTSVR